MNPFDFQSQRLWIVSGARGAGKTRWCEQLVQAERKAGRTVGGLLSPGRWVDGHKTEIYTEDLRSGEKRLLAVATTPTERGRWQFNEETLVWGKERLGAALPCALLVIDEIGRLELVEQRGWTSVWSVLAQATYRHAVLVVRPSLIEVAQRQLSEIGYGETAVYVVGRGE